jgi:archaellum biogenesis ATPase FlaH
MQIPGQAFLTRNKSIPNSIFILNGNQGAGKSVYCREFFKDGLINGDSCIYIDCLLDNSEFFNSFLEITIENTNHNSFFINPYKIEVENSMKLARTLQEVAAVMKSEKSESSGTKNIRLVVDSITHLLVLFNEKEVEDFVKNLYFLLKSNNAMAILVYTVPSLNDQITNRLSCLSDGIIEMRIEEDSSINTNSSNSYYSSMRRRIRILSIRNTNHIPQWVQLEISNEGNIIFSKTDIANCYLCKEPIVDDLVIYSDLSFHSFHLEMYKKLNRLYGINVADMGVSSSETINCNFFFIDIVGLSNPSLPVNRQREKIENLNDLISSCDAFKEDDNKVILPTGDGMVIGYLINPELPLQLSIQLHRKLHEYNNRKSNNHQEEIGVRIGLSSGPVFKVNDIRNNPNYWGPGIILARRVMDIGDKGHILMDHNLAHSLITLKNEYSNIIKAVGKYKIKHMVEIDLYSVYSKDFGNPQLPVVNKVTN